MLLVSDAGRLTGRYRLGAALEEWTLEGTIDGKGRFDAAVADERGVVTGRLKGKFVAWGRILGTWSSTDGRALPLSVDRGDHYVPVVRVGSSVRIFPSYKATSLRTCSTDVVFPQITGMSNPALEKATNDTLAGFGKGDFTDHYCDSAPELREDSSDFEQMTAQQSGIQRYEVAAVRHPYVALSTDGEHANGALRPVHDVACAVLDTSTGQLSKAIDALRSTERTAFERIMSLHFDQLPSVIGRRKEGMPLTAPRLDTSATLCLTEHGLSVVYLDPGGPPVLESFDLPGAEVRALFDGRVAPIWFP